MKASAQQVERKPDLDWSQIKETVLLLNLAVAQIDKGMNEGDDSVSVLSESLMFVMSKMNSVNEVAHKLEEIGLDSNALKDWDQVSGKLQSIVVALQFYDKLSQRLGHLSYSLGSLGELIGDGGRLFNPAEWNNLQDLIRSRYTIDSDRAMFEAVLSGASVEDALLVKEEAAIKEEDDEDSVELF